MTRTERWILAVTALVVLGAAVVLGLGGRLFAALDDRPPSGWHTPAGMCPEEDSCTADYRSGGWHISKGE